MEDHPTLQSREKVQECEDFLVETVTERLELVSTVTPSRKSLSWMVGTNRRHFKPIKPLSRGQKKKSAGKWQRRPENPGGPFVFRLK